MTLTVLEPEGLYPDTSLEQRIMGPPVRILQGACKVSLAELPDALCEQADALMTLRMAVPADQIARFLPSEDSRHRSGDGFDQTKNVVFLYQRHDALLKTPDSTP